MPLSANTLIHFTQEKSSLKDILSDNFKIFYCKETVILNGVSGVYRVPMVSFCDIPLSEVKEHINKYGKYGIGLTKDWGIKNKLNPVLYISKNSSLSASYEEALHHFIGDDVSTSEQKALLDIARYLKNYEGDLVRKGTTIQNYRFSDEREWRYVPHYKEDLWMLALESAYSKPEVKAECDDKLKNLRLYFEPNDIKYIIIDNESEISEFIEHLRRAKSKFSYEDIERLTTRIITSQQIISDM